MFVPLIGRFFGNEDDMETYKNYIFDLYGTLLDIHTDENDKELWKIMRDFYNVYGCEWKQKPLKDAFFLYDAGERQRLSVLTGVKKPEIRIERVFARLLFEGGGHHSCSLTIAGSDIDSLRKQYKEDIEGVLTKVADSEWAAACANLFRTASREYVRLYPNSMETLRSLKDRGCRLYLLSNAQKIFTMPEIEAFGLQDILDKIYISSDFGMMKPEPDFLNRLMSEEGLKKEETVMVGNEIESDVAIAIRCGIGSICLNTFGLKKKELNKRVSEVLNAYKAPDELTPLIIRSGDIGEILK